MTEEKALKEIHEIREKIFLMDKNEKKNLLLKIRKKYESLFV